MNLSSSSIHDAFGEQVLLLHLLTQRRNHPGRVLSTRLDDHVHDTSIVPLRIALREQQEADNGHDDKRLPRGSQCCADDHVEHSNVVEHRFGHLSCQHDVRIVADFWSSYGKLNAICFYCE